MAYINSGKESTFNEAALKMQRLDELQQVLNRLIVNMLYWDNEIGMYSYQLIPGVLEGLYLELYGHLSDKELEEAEAERKLINEAINYLPIKIKIVNESLSGTKVTTTINQNNLRIIQELLFKFQTKLRKWIEVHKLGTPTAKDPSKAAIDF